MPIQRFPPIHKGQPLGEAIGARSYNARTRAIMRADNMAGGAGMAAIFNDSFHAYAQQGVPPGSRLRVVQLTDDILPPFTSDVEMSSSSSSQSAGGVLPHNAVEMMFNQGTQTWVQPSAPVTLRVVDPYGLVYDSGSIQVVYYDSENDQWVIIPRDTVRIAQTVVDVDGEYPPIDGQPNVYAIKFLDTSYTQDAGQQTLTSSQKSTAVADAYCYNLLGGYIAEGDIIFVFWQQGQWYALADASGEADECCLRINEQTVTTGAEVDANGYADVYSLPMRIGQTYIGSGTLKCIVACCNNAGLYYTIAFNFTARYNCTPGNADDAYLDVQMNVISEATKVAGDLSATAPYTFRLDVWPTSRIFFPVGFPTVTDDDDAGYMAGDVWFAQTPYLGDFRYWICDDATAGAAVWTIQTIQVPDMIQGGPPTVNDDSGGGWSVGQWWLDGLDVYRCRDNTLGAAVWQIQETSGLAEATDSTYGRGPLVFRVDLDGIPATQVAQESGDPQCPAIYSNLCMEINVCNDPGCNVLEL